MNPVASIHAPITVTNSAGGTGKLIADGTVDFTGASNPSTVYQLDVTPSVTDSTGIVNLQPTAVVTVLTTSEIGALNIGQDATLTLQRRSASPASSGARVLRVNSLFIEKDATAPEGVLDLKDNAMIIDHTGDSPFADTRLYIVSGYNGGAWTGDGINSSIAATTTNTGIGYAENDGTSSGVNYSTFEGQAVDATSVLVKYTFYGDANLGWGVNLQDFNRLAANFGQMGLGPDTLPSNEEGITQEDLEEMLEEWQS